MQFHWFSTSHTTFLKISGPHSLVEIHKELKLSLITCLEISCICLLGFYVMSFSKIVSLFLVCCPITKLAVCFSTYSPFVMARIGNMP
jgi:hypothetical protein